MFNPLRITTGRRISTAAGGRLMTAMTSSRGFGRPDTNAKSVQEGEFTSTVYTLLTEKKYEDVKEILLHQIELFPNSRAALSLLAYCHYMLQDFQSACVCYEQLVRLYPEVDHYKIYYAQSLQKAAQYPESLKMCSTIESVEHESKVNKIRASSCYEQDDHVAARTYLQKCLQDDPEVLVMEGCIAYKEMDFDLALRKFTEAMDITGWDPHISYNIALCNYCFKKYSIALRCIQEIMEHGIQNHPELSVGAASDGYEVRSVGNSRTLRSTALVEAFNLKCAIYFQMRNYETALESLRYMPPRKESELDAVTLHNQALLQMGSNPTAGFKKLKYLIQTPPFPPETFSNLLILYCQHQYYYLAADILAENPHLSMIYLTQDLYDFLEALIEAQTAPEEAFHKFDILATGHIEQLRTLTNMIHAARQQSNNNVNSDAVRDALRQYEEALESYIPILMAMGKIYWDINNFTKVEEILQQNVEFCEENPVWKLNMAHTCFMAEKFHEAIEFYKPAFGKQQASLLDVPAMVLANLCVSYIMTSQNEEAEEWMRNVEKEEDAVTRADPDRQVLHLCIVNLVIGTLYCSKGHYEFGISRVIKSLEPYDKKIMEDTWFYAKRCFLSLAQTMAKHMVVIKDESLNEIIHFLNAAEMHGREIVINKDQILQSRVSHQHNTMNSATAAQELMFPQQQQQQQQPPMSSHGMGVRFASATTTIEDKRPTVDEPAEQTVSHESRLLKKLYLQLIE